MKKSVLITGAGTGLGRQASIELARRGHKVFATVRYENEIISLQEISSREQLDLEAFKLDILNKDDRNKLLEYDIDVLICNAAIGDSGSVADIDVNRFRGVFETNVFCNIETVQIALNKMINEKRKGRIIFISSLAGRIPFAFLSPYCSSKFAIEGFATCLKKEMKKLDIADIEVAIIEPGAYATGFNNENNEKKYKWMNKKSYFSYKEDKIKKNEQTLWKFIEVKTYDSIIKQYVKAVEDKRLKHRYTAPKLQSIGVQILRILGK